MPERIVILVAAALVVALGISLAQFAARVRTRQLQATPGGALLERLGTHADGRATLVAFSTPSCAACRTAQAPALAEVAHTVDDAQLRVVHVDAAHQPDIAQAFGIMTVPSTVVLDATGRVAAINHGFASPQQLVRQLQSI